MFESQLGNSRIWLFKFLSRTARRSKKQDAAGILTGNSKRTSAVMSYALEQLNAPGIGVIREGPSRASHFLLARVQFPTCFPIGLSHIHLATSLYIICFLPTVFKTFCSNKRESLTGKSWEFSDIASDTPALRAHDGTSLDVNKANGMLTSNTKGIFCDNCDNVTCFGTNKSCSNRSHLQECFQYSSLLACKGTVSNLFSNWSFPHTPCNFPLYYMFPANCFQNILFQQAGISDGKKLIKSDIASDISAPWEHGSTSLDVNKANGMLTSNTKGIFCDNATCFATNQTCSNESHLQECFQYSSLLACKGTAFNVFFQFVFPAYPLQLLSVCVLSTVLAKLLKFYVSQCKA